MFEFLFNHSLDVFQQASWLFARDWSVWLLLIAIAVALPVIIFSLRSQRKKFKDAPGLLLVVAFFQWVALSTVLVMLWQPILEVSSTAPEDNAISVLIDNSTSMWSLDDGTAEDEASVEASASASDSATGQIPPPESRLGRAIQAFSSDGVIEALQEKFTLRFSQFAQSGDATQIGSDTSGTATAIESLQDLSAPGTRTALLQELGKEMRSAGERSPAGIVLVTDGGHNARSVDSEWWQSVSALNVPVYVVAAGQNSLPGDVELADVDIPGELIPGSSVPVRLSLIYDLPTEIANTGASAQTVVRMFSGDDLLLVEDVQLPADRKRLTHTSWLDLPEESLLELRVELSDSITTSDGQRFNDRRMANNTRHRVLPLAGQPRRVLYIEGEPRWEFKFMRRAISSFNGLELVSLLRTSPNKLYRQGVKDAAELQDGFPVSREALFAYDALIIGSLEAAYLSPEQQRNIQDFVRVRGGTLLMLAGRNGLADGGWGRSPVAQALPAGLNGALPSFSRERMFVAPTLLGKQTEWLTLAASNTDDAQAWDGLPEVADFQRLGDIKPGASVLLQTTGSTSQSSQPVLLWQRYGRGKSYVLATSGTWRWQMGLPAADQRHEAFWQGFMGELVTGVQSRLSVSTDQFEYLDSSSAKLTVDTRNAEFQPDSQQTPQVTIFKPDGSETTVAMQADRAIAGRAVADLDVQDVGAYRLEVSLGSQPDINATRWFMRENNRAEDFGVRRNDALLQRLAASTGGAVLELDELSQLPQLMSAGGSLLVRHSELPLWNMPIFFLLIFVCKLVEWLLRWRAGRI